MPFYSRKLYLTTAAATCGPRRSLHCLRAPRAAVREVARHLLERVAERDGADEGVATEVTHARARLVDVEKLGVQVAHLRGDGGERVVGELEVSQRGHCLDGGGERA